MIAAMDPLTILGVLISILLATALKCARRDRRRPVDMARFSRTRRLTHWSEYR
jgi:hypothetical protein